MTKRATTAASTTGSAREILGGRLLVVTGDTDARQHVPLIDRDAEGLVLTSHNRVKDARAIRQYAPDVVTVIEPQYAMTAFATPERPLVLPDDDGLMTFDVDAILDAQRDAGAHIAMTPTGYVRAGEPDTLRAVVAASHKISRDDTLHRVFLAPQYLHPDNLRQTRAILRKCHLPIALTVASKTDPMLNPGVVDGLRDLFSTLEWAMLWRGDLAAFDALAHGAPSASIGTLTSTRHGVPADQRGQRSPEDRTPSVLVVELARYIRSGKLRNWYAATTAPSCPCQVCQGRTLDRFEDEPADRAIATEHNLLAMRALRERLFAAADMRTAWHEYVEDAITAHAEVAALTSVKTRVPGVLNQWALRQPLPVVAASTVSSSNQDAGE